MQVSTLIGSYGYLAVFVGAFLEGETILALAGLAAFHGYLDLYTVIAIALTAGFAGDQLYFFVGRYNGARILARFPGAQARAHRLDAMLARWHAPLIIAIRFLYGLRIAGPVLLGMGRVPGWKFMLYNFVGAAIWAPLVVGVGYAFGSVVEALIANVEQYEMWLFVAVIALGIAGAGVHALLSRRRERAKQRPRIR
ncbi:MAG TPA: DedA family protein [Usitatibacter sp.]|nr:DedA family protein [Usitatibacter sp.]